eukprot:NODE_2908_length_449_cov_151.285000_g2307_i0.p1 GENE.NODE_2908_length_449_cov_151.285000_g2307_i0~~NODE_2908_length_449_cov_151.285000_g2307_i0.p1  ORF type:complete len:129 (+),score=45.71 NODE_2908_length_449_cov_151.285000_g2307_i0:56-388(+)
MKVLFLLAIVLCVSAECNDKKSKECAKGSSACKGFDVDTPAGLPTCDCFKALIWCGNKNGCVNDDEKKKADCNQTKTFIGNCDANCDGSGLVLPSFAAVILAVFGILALA